MKHRDDIPLHSLRNRDFYAAYTENINFGDYDSHHRIDFFAIIWYLEDGKDQLIDFANYPVKKNVIYLLSKDQVHALPGPPPASKVILFTDVFFDRLSEEYRLPFLPFNNDGINVTTETEPVLANLFDLMLQENQADNASDLLYHYLCAYLTHVNRLANHDGVRSVFQDKRLLKLFTLIHVNYRTEKYSSFYSDKLGVSNKRINQIVQQELGYSVTQLIGVYTLVEAKRQISQKLKSLKEISIELGFNSQSYFSRFFRKQTGISPETFRQQQN